MDRTSRAKRQCFNVNLFIDDDLAVRASLRQKYAVLHAGLNALAVCQIKRNVDRIACLCSDPRIINIDRCNQHRRRRSGGLGNKRSGKKKRAHQ